MHDRLTNTVPFRLPLVPRYPGMEVWALAYEVTARKWRPQEFDGVIGQEHVTTTLKNAIQAGQIAHAYLFAGPRGVGKTTTARILAKALNCVEGPTVTPCNACSFCREISEGRSVDVLEIDGASNNRVEQVRTHLLESVKYTPSQGKHKIYIIDEVHMLTKEAFNALLKTLEEPPAHVYFIFATTDPRKVIPTVLSRCQRFDFRRISGPTIADHLAMISEQSGYDIQREALALIARRVDGSMRDAESLLDQVVAFGGTGLTAREAAEVLGIVDQDVYFELLDIVADQDVPRGLDLVDSVFRQGHDLEEIILGVLEHLRNLLVVKAAPEADALLGAAALAFDRYREQAERFDTEDLLRLSQLATQMEQSVKQSALPRVQLETGIVRMIRMAKSVQLTDVMTRLSDLARRVGSGEEVDAPDAAVSEEAKPHAGARESNHSAARTVAQPKSGDAAESGPSDAPPESRPAGPGPSAGASPTASSAPPVTAYSKSPAAAPASSSSEEPAASSSRAPDQPQGTSPAPDDQAPQAPDDLAPQDPGTSVEPETATVAAPVPDIRKVRSRWPSIVKEITAQRSALGSFMAEAEVSACAPPDDDRPGAPARITLSFGASGVFHKQQAEKRENAALIQNTIANVLGIPVRIACEIADGPVRDESNILEETPAGDAQGPSPGAPSAESATSVGSVTSAGKETGARSGAAKDPAVMKIVEAFDGQIVTE